MSVQRYGCEGETSRNCLHHARAAASEPYQPPGFLPTCGDPTPRVAFLSVTWVRCAIFWRKSPATKLFQPISLGNRPPQTISAHFLRKSAATKLFRLISSGNRWMGFHSFPQEIAGWASTHFLEEIAGMAHIKLTLFLRRTHVSVDAHGKAPF